MSDSVSSNKRIAKNTFILYLRMIFILCVGLYTSRIVLNTLGVEDYGIYNVVGGFVAFFSFLNGAMSNATQRFITFELARGDEKRQITTFSTAAIIHFVIALLIVIIAETIGLWFVCHKLVIPKERFVAAIWVYQFSILTTFVSIVSIPYNAAIIAHEKMSVFAYISILDALLKLVIVYLLTIVTFDRLIFYASLLLGISLLDRLIYGIYCKYHFKEARVKLIFNKKIFKEMTGWNRDKVTVYVLCGYDSTMEENLERIEEIRKLNFQPYVMLYDKQHIKRGDELRKLQRWVNAKQAFWKCSFEEYQRR